LGRGGLKGTGKRERALIRHLLRRRAAGQKCVRSPARGVGVDQVAGDAVGVSECRGSHRTRLRVLAAWQTTPVGRGERAVAVRSENLVLVMPIECDVKVITVAAQIAHAPDAGCMLGGSVTVLGRAALDGEFGPDEGLFQFDVHHARDRVGTVHGRCAVFEHFNRFDRIDRDRRHIDEAAFPVVAQRVGDHALSVNQGQRVAHRQTAQRDAASAGRECLTEALIQRARSVRRQSTQHIRHVRVARVLQINGSNDLHRTRRLRVGALDQGSGDDDFLKFVRTVRG